MLLLFLLALALPMVAFANNSVDFTNAGGNPNADVPDLVGLGLMSDGDQTRSTSAADYATFQLVQ